MEGQETETAEDLQLTTHLATQGIKCQEGESVYEHITYKAIVTQLCELRLSLSPNILYLNMRVGLIFHNFNPSQWRLTCNV